MRKLTRSLNSGADVACFTIRRRVGREKTISQKWNKNETVKTKIFCVVLCDYMLTQLVSNSATNFKLKYFSFRKHVQSVSDLPGKTSNLPDNCPMTDCYLQA